MFSNSKLAVCIAIIVLLTSCQKSDLTSPELPGPSPKLMKIYTDAGNFSEYEYDGEKLISYVSYSGNRLSASKKLKYDENRRPVREDCFDTGEAYYKLYYYDPFGRVNKMELYIGDSQLFGYLLYKYDENNCVIKREQYALNSEVPWNYSCYTYDKRGNVASNKFYVNDILQDSTEYTYDDKRNPQFFLKNSFMYLSAYSKNNVTNSVTTTYEYTPNIVKEQTVYISYTYNNLGYPASRKIEINNNGAVSSTISEYFYK